MHNARTPIGADDVLWELVVVVGPLDVAQAERAADAWRANPGDMVALAAAAAARVWTRTGAPPPPPDIEQHTAAPEQPAAKRPRDDDDDDNERTAKRQLVDIDW
jgi:hypothetical protein